MPGNNSLLPRNSLPLIIALILLLVFTLSACGTNSTTTGGALPSTPTSASTPTSTTGQSSSTGCPDKTTVTAASSTANVVLKGNNSNKPVDVKKGDVIEVDLAFGHNWDGPSNLSKTMLTQQASGYTNTTSKMCVWSFLAVGTGTAHVNFIGRPICNKGEACPQYIQAVSFILNIKS